MRRREYICPSCHGVSTFIDGNIIKKYIYCNGIGKVSEQKHLNWIRSYAIDTIKLKKFFGQIKKIDNLENFVKEKEK